MSKLFRLLSDTPLGDSPFIQTAAGLMISLLSVLALSAVMMLVYRLCHDSLTYNHTFNVTLLMLALASDILLALIQNNSLFSLGALGALSICRIRTNTRDPRDLGFVFWALTIGIRRIPDRPCRDCCFKRCDAGPWTYCPQKGYFNHGSSRRKRAGSLCTECIQPDSGKYDAVEKSVSGFL